MLNQIIIWPGVLVSWARRRFSGHDELGASLVEYALLLALIAVVAIGALTVLGHTVTNTVNTVTNGFTPTT
ncbi:MAG: Flp family type IVb pilin [Acidimicrobiales bacterium]|jgi:pilus assembly protein Flp/PilA